MRLNLTKLSILIVGIFFCVFLSTLYFFKTQFNLNINSYFFDNLKENIFEANYTLTNNIYSNSLDSFLSYADRKILTSKYIKEFSILQNGNIILSTNRNLKNIDLKYKFIDEIEHLDDIKDDIYIASHIKYIANNQLQTDILLIKLDNIYIQDTFLKNFQNPLFITVFFTLIGTILIFLVVKFLVVRPIKLIVNEIESNQFDIGLKFTLNEFTILQSTLLKHIDYEIDSKEEIQFNEKYLRAILDLQHDIIVVIDGNSKLLDASQSFFRFFNEFNTIDDFNKKNLHICSLFEQIDRNGYLIINVCGENCNDCIINNNSYKVVMKDSIFSVFSHQLNFNSEERLIITFKDITEFENQNLILEKRIEDELKNRLISEKFYENIINSTSDGILVFDYDLKLSIYNQASENIFGYKRDDESIKYFIENLIPINLIDELKINKKQIQLVELKALNKAYKDIDIELSLVSREIDSKFYIIAVIRDLTEKKNQERMLIQQSKMAQMGEMIGAIAHQWKQPLNAIGLYVQELDSEFDFDEKIDEILKERVSHMSDSVMQELEFMSQTIDDFRNFFKPNKNRENFSITKAINETLSIVSPQLKSHSINVDITFSENYIDNISGYKNEFKQVILNLLTNSKDAIESHKKISNNIYYIGRIDINLSKEDNFALIEVLDNGGGIESNFLERLFKPYSTTKVSGTGIGLYMSKNIIESMGGELRAENVENGAKFIIKLRI